MPLDRDQVITALRTVHDPELFKDIVTLNLVKDVQVESQPDSSMKVTIKIASSELIEEVLSKTSGMTEMSKVQTSFEVEP